MQISGLREELSWLCEMNWVFCPKCIPENFNSILLVSKSSYTLNSVREIKDKSLDALLAVLLTGGICLQVMTIPCSASCTDCKCHQANNPSSSENGKSNLSFFLKSHTLPMSFVAVAAFQLAFRVQSNCSYLLAQGFGKSDVSSLPASCLDIHTALELLCTHSQRPVNCRSC